MSILTYKGYTAQVEFDAEEHILYGRVLDLRHVINFQSESAREIEREFHVSVDEYLAFCKEQGIEPAKPFSGKLVFRMGSWALLMIGLQRLAASIVWDHDPADADSIDPVYLHINSPGLPWRDAAIPLTRHHQECPRAFV